MRHPIRLGRAAARQPRINLIRDLLSLGHRFLLGTVEALDLLRHCHPGVVDGSHYGLIVLDAPSSTYDWLTTVGLSARDRTSRRIESCIGSAPQHAAQAALTSPVGMVRPFTLSTSSPSARPSDLNSSPPGPRSRNSNVIEPACSFDGCASRSGAPAPDRDIHVTTAGCNANAPSSRRVTCPARACASSLRGVPPKATRKPTI